MEKKPERRKYKRYPAKEGVYAQPGPESNIVGQIVDFSRGGLCFRYLFNAEQVEKRRGTLLSIRNNGVSIEMLPCKTVCDAGFTRAPCCTMDVETRLRRVKFGPLSHNKASQLEYFLGINKDN